MRKADYQTLAEIIRTEREAGLAQHRAGSIGGTLSGFARIAAAERIARTFTCTASVDRAAFLKACGID